MIGYITVGSNDLPRAVAFYDELLAEVGGKRMMEEDSFVAWTSDNGASFAVTKPFDGQAATVGNGVMVAIAVASREDVDRVYAKAMALGATDEGPAGARGEDGFYAGYFRDLDGNKLNVFVMG